ncbi:YSC84-related protein [Caulobacter sp. 17J80-11]|uniref:lipid-binding SYLF domain-containing protein n=1 Tax=Caulobacter sp. 17J80-11 TaxID=2763502 RepID=UPI00165395AD|nr:lipid-binding SYLF domain-containing protein [Caulobacter sp. 17J80-11]MBC6983163.1 lipid-binding SYLF domain-containing protein [Caulobacter sp. 17J80-11]
MVTKTSSSSRRVFLAGSVAALAGVGSEALAAAPDAGLEAEAQAALKQLLASNEAARIVSGKAKGVLVFPKVTKGGLVFGGQYGKGVLKVGKKVDGYYETVAGSWGLQAGVKTFSYALFFTTTAALERLKSSSGWELGADPSVVVVDEGAAKRITTTTVRDGVYAFVFGQKGLMAGVSLEGTKINRLK